LSLPRIERRFRGWSSPDSNADAVISANHRPFVY
jgi:hypothetical protein